MVLDYKIGKYTNSGVLHQEEQESESKFIIVDPAGSVFLGRTKDDLKEEGASGVIYKQLNLKRPAINTEKNYIIFGGGDQKKGSVTNLSKGQAIFNGQYGKYRILY